MFVRKPLVLAMLAAGIIASDGLPEAQSTVFVPELAMLDGALCTLEFEDHRPLYDWFNERVAEAGFFKPPLSNLPQPFQRRDNRQEEARLKP